MQILQKNMAVMTGDGPSPHFPSLHLSLTAPQPSTCHHAQSLLGPSFHNPRTHHVLKSTPSKPHLSHATTSHDMLSALTSPLHSTSIWQPTTPPQDGAFESWTISATVCFNRSRFTFAEITEIRSLNPCVCVWPFLLCFCFSDRNELQL